MDPGIYLVHKPVGPTSFSIVADFKSRAGKLKVCHGGALDPFATGLLLILVGEATKLFDYLHDIPKVYEATIRWGIETDNGDPNGRVVATADPSAISQELIDAALRHFIGWQDQTPPMHSNKRIAGERAYVKAHRGETFELPSSRVYLHGASWLDHDLPRQSRLRVIVRGGFYVRALARDIGRLLGCGAHLAELHRTAIGPWPDPGPDRVVEIRGRELLPWLPARNLTDQEVGELRATRSIPIKEILAPDWMLPSGFPRGETLIRALHLDRVIFLLQQVDKELRVFRSFRGGL